MRKPEVPCIQQQQFLNVQRSDYPEEVYSDGTTVWLSRYISVQKYY